MGKGGKGSCHKRKQRQKAACIFCTAILIIIIIILIVLYVAVFRPKDPTVRVPRMQLLSLYPVGYPLATTSANLTLNLEVSIYNPNKATFIVQDGGIACLYYYGSQVGFTPIPTGSIPSESFSTIFVPLTVQGTAPLQGPYLLEDVTDGILQVSTSVTIFGKVTTVNLFTHHAEVVSKCNINVSFNDRGIESYTCQRSFTIDP